MLVGLLLWGQQAAAVTPDQLAEARNRGVAWLLMHQNRSGSWGTRPEQEVHTTAEAIAVLQAAGITSIGYPQGLSWIVGVKVDSIASLSRKIVTLAEANSDVGVHVARLAEGKNTENAWGGYARFATSFPETALALKAIRRARATVPNEGLNAILAGQQIGGAASDGSWGYTKPVQGMASVIKGAIVPTAQNLLELHAKQATGLTSWGGFSIALALDRGAGWLLRQTHHADGGFGVGSQSTVAETALAYEALVTLRPQEARTREALEFLVKQQRPDGSWNSDAVQTAVATRVLSLTQSPLPDSDRDGMPDAIERILGTNPLAPDKQWLAQGGGGLAPIVPLFPSGRGVAAVVPEGDVNGDGLVDVADLALLEQIVMGVREGTTGQLSQGDVFPAGAPDGAITGADLIMLKRKVLGGVAR